MGVITSLFAHKMIAAAGSAVDQRSLLASVGLDPEAQIDPKKMLVDTVYYDLLERMARMIDVTDLGIRTGESMQLDEYGALGLAWKAAPTLLGSYSRVERYARLWTSVVEYELRPANGGTLFILHRTGERRLGLRLSNEATLASAVSLSRQVSPMPFAPLEVHIKHRPPRTREFHERYFGCPVLFGSDLDALLLSPESLAQPNKLGDKGITEFLDSHLEGELRQVVDDATIEKLAKDVIARSLSEGIPKMGDVARSLGLSVRSLHRRLADDGLSFRTLTETTRKELAEGLLRDERYSLSEVAFLTGFSEQSAFNRAFKRWIGRSPLAYRKVLLGL
ncbi:AraC family transcriptional regulator [Defluviimonas aestuarii]|uniref:AraC family transcriptional regulator n=1 Tax=Albidovulum aestuarii TaxID=1130726 RepID=UPI00249C0AE2|nr:AraC family transcriptional regulator [Defluviimonas aestuarii]MDI3337712.1 AraC family transcriptional regulator [Defluviimonas aestuarii]